MKRTIAIALAVVAVTVAHSQAKSWHFVPKEGYVPTAVAAIAVAEAVLIPVYGEKTILDERPFSAVLKDGVWIVTGSVRCDGPTSGAPCPGGAAEVRISKKSGQILKMVHYQ